MKFEEGYRLVDINDISLDPSNPRHDPVKEDRLALEALMKTTKFDDKIIYLMKDILEFGQNPIDIIGLLITEQQTVYSKEGNRRVAAFKILNNPNLIKTSNHKLYERVLNILKDFDKPNSKIMCYLTHDANILDHAIELKHQGEQGGAGTVTWGSKEKARHKRNKGIHDPIHAFLNELETNEIISSKKRDNITKTNWERLFTKDGQLWLGIQKKDDNFEIIDNFEDFIIKFQLITDKIENETHHIITNIEARAKLFSELNIEFEKIKNKSSETNKINDVEKQEDTTEKIYEDSETNKSENDDNKKISPKSTTDTKKQETSKEDIKPAPKKFRLQELYVAKNSKISPEQHTAFINIHKELEKLSSGQYGFYKTYKLSTYYLIRALIEQCLKFWLSTYHPKQYCKSINNTDANLGKMIEQINKCLTNNNDIFFDRTINKHFLTFFGNYTTKDTLDLLIHHPYLLPDDINVLHGYTSGILFEILNYILTYEER